MESQASAETKPLFHITPKKRWHIIDFRELWQYRELFYFLVLRDIRVRYKQTVLGGLWAIIQPLFTMVVFSLFFGRLAGIPSDNTPYPIFAYTALVAWTYFATSITGSGSSLIMDTKLISKVYFPRLLIPLTPVLAGVLDFSIAFIVLIGMMFYFHFQPTAMILLVPFLVLLMMLIASGTSTILAALNVKYRDIRYAIPFLVQLWMFASPIAYPVSLVPQEYRLLYALNPMAGVIEGFRSVLLGTVAFPTTMIMLSTIIGLAVFSLGLFVFKQTEWYFADII